MSINKRTGRRKQIITVSSYYPQKQNGSFHEDAGSIDEQRVLQYSNMYIFIFLFVCVFLFFCLRREREEAGSVVGVKTSGRRQASGLSSLYSLENIL